MDLVKKDSLKASISDLLTDPKYSDLEIRCDGLSFMVHRNVVCPRSKVIARECDGQFQDATTRIIKHSVFDAFAVDRMLQYIYRGNYFVSSSLVAKTSAIAADAVGAKEKTQDPSTNDSDPAANFIAHIMTFTIAEYYDVPDLRILAWTQFSDESKKSRSLKAETLLSIATTLYQNTTSTAGLLREVLCLMTYDQLPAGPDSNIFMDAIATNRELQQFAAELVTNAFSRYRRERSFYQKVSKGAVERAELAREAHLVEVQKLKDENAALRRGLPADSTALFERKRKATEQPEGQTQDTSRPPPKPFGTFGSQPVPSTTQPSPQPPPPVFNQPSSASGGGGFTFGQGSSTSTGTGAHGGVNGGTRFSFNLPAN